MNPDLDRAIDALIAEIREEQNLPGVVVAVVQNGTAIKVAAQGWASLELSAPMTENTVFCIGSLTKQFTATAILQLIEAGKLHLDDSIAPWPEAFLEGTIPDGWKAITIRHLLTHTSGLKRDAVMFRPTENSLPPDYIPVLYEWGRQEFTPERLVRELAALPLDFAPPGTKMSYSNAGFYLLGCIIERASGLTYADYLALRVTGPLQMRHTRLVTDVVLPHRASGYTRSNGIWYTGGYISPSRDHAAGSLTSTIGDLILWDRAWRRGALLTPETRELMWSPAALNDGTILPYGLGWSVTTEAFPSGNSRRAVGHGGMWGGFTAHWLRLLDDDLTVIALTNLGISGRCPEGGVSGKPSVLTGHIARMLT